MIEHDIFNEIVKLHMPKEIDGWVIHVRMFDDDYKQYNGRKILEMKAICREFPRVHTIRTVMPFENIDEYVSKDYVEKLYSEYIYNNLYSMLHKIMDVIISGGELDE
jgi:hypothetical protein